MMRKKFFEKCLCSLSLFGFMNEQLFRIMNDQNICEEDNKMYYKSECDMFLRCRRVAQEREEHSKNHAHMKKANKAHTFLSCQMELLRESTRAWTKVKTPLKLLMNWTVEKLINCKQHLLWHFEHLLVTNLYPQH